MRLRVLASPIARVMEDCGGRPGAAERLVVADVDPGPSGVGLAFRQHRHGRVVAVQALARRDMGLDEALEGIERHADGAYGVGHGGQRDRRALERIALGLPVQRLVLAELLEHDHRQQAWSRPSPRYHMERRRRLADRLAVPAGELLPHRLDHLPPPGACRLQHVTCVTASSPSLRRRMAAASTRRPSADRSPPARAADGRGTCRARRAGGRRRGPSSSWRLPAPPPVRLPWRRLQVPRSRAPADRSAAPSAPTATRRPGARAWRSAASARR